MPRNILRSIRAFMRTDLAFALALLLVSVLSYGLLVTQLGIYSDDWQMLWLWNNGQLASFFVRNRPLLAGVYQPFADLVGATPVVWHSIGVLIRWIAALCVFGLFSLTWPKLKRLAMATSLLFLVYPGYNIQYIPMLYLQKFLNYTGLLLSLIFTLLAVRESAANAVSNRSLSAWRALLFTFLAMLCQGFTLLTEDIFYTLELIRFVLIWIVVGESAPAWWPRLKRTLFLSAPYLAVYIAVSLWRILNLSTLTRYSIAPLAGLSNNPIQTVLDLAGHVLEDVALAGIAGWSRAFTHFATWIPSLTSFVILGLVVVVSVGIFVFIAISRSDEAPLPKKEGLQILATALLALFLTGWPYWLAGLDPTISGFDSRFTMPFMLGSSLLMATIFLLIPGKPWIRLAVLSLVVGFSASAHFNTANQFRKDWLNQKNLFWQIAWRMPSLKPGTLLIYDHLNTFYNSDNAFSSALNWVYRAENPEANGSLAMVSLGERFGNSPASGVANSQDFKNAWSYDHAIVIYQEPGKCLWTLDPGLETYYGTLGSRMRQAAGLSRLSQIQVSGDSVVARPAASPFGAEPAHDWCYFYEKADLARQYDDWAAVKDFYQQAKAKGFAPVGLYERLPLIEAYAHDAAWDRAQAETVAALDTPNSRPPLCALWDRIKDETPASPQKDMAITHTRQILGCP
ncbi:MAG TPA: hypothetical protein VMT46_04280 [Anaerolineaceae bacterium]|nr:hypothetical protein [Anaerolineaceae bacterium]